MIKISTMIKVNARVDEMVELVKEIEGVKIFCANFRRKEVKVDTNGIVLVSEIAYNRNEKNFFNAIN